MLYDESGEITGFIYNNAYYYYQKNLQRDVVRIVNAAGTVVVEYTYDVWGNVLSVTGSLADTIGHYNPFRYRSYYYDTETGWYYLQSRYYDPVVGRFLNADGTVGANGGIEGNNLFAYCNNNPVKYADPAGCALLPTTKIYNDGSRGKFNDSSSGDAQQEESANTGEEEKPTEPVIPDNIIPNQGTGEKLLGGEYMEDISFGFGNIADNGCGVIAAYNILVTWNPNTDFYAVRNSIVLLGGTLFGGFAGSDPAVLAAYMSLKCGFSIAFAQPYLWDDLASKSDAVIVLTFNTKGFAMHYFAGIKQSDGDYIFYNSKLWNSADENIDGVAISIDELINYIVENKKIPILMVGVNKL